MLRNSVTGVVVLGLLVSGSAAVHAQTPDSAAGRETASDVRVRPSSQVVLMQHALELAVRSGASDLLTQMSRVTRVPPFAQLNGLPQAQGFELPGYGMFFYVRVPGMSGIVLNALPFLIEVDGQQLPGAVQPRQGQGMVRAAGVPPDGVAPPVSPDPVTHVSQADLNVLKDPDPHYVQAIRSALIDAMLENSRSLRMQPDEYLSVAARREDAGMDPRDPSDRLQPMLFTVRGSVLGDYHQGRLTLDEARKLVTVTTD